MATTSHHQTLLTSSSSAQTTTISSPSSSSSAPVPVWMLNPLLLSSAVIITCLISTVVSAANLEDAVLSSHAIAIKDTGGKIHKMDTLLFTRTSTSSSSLSGSSSSNSNNNRVNHRKNRAVSLSKTSSFHTKHNEVRNFAILLGISPYPFPQSTARTKDQVIPKITDPRELITGNLAWTEQHHLTQFLKATHSDTILGDEMAEDESSKFVNFQSNTGIMDISYDDQSNISTSHKQNKQSDHSFPHGELSLLIDQTGRDPEANKISETLAAKYAKHNLFDFLETITTAGLKSFEFSLTQFGFKPISAMPLPSPHTVSPSRRYPRSVNKNTEDDLSNGMDEELMSRTLHFVDKLQSKSQPCQSHSDRIIILKAAKFRPNQFFPVFAEEVHKTVEMANIINDLLLFTKSPPQDFMDIFFAMTQSLVETGPQVRGCAIAFSLLSTVATSSGGLTPESASSETSPNSKPQTSYEPQSLFPYSYRTRDEAVVVTDLSMLYKPQTTTWFSVHVNRSTEGLLKPKNRIYANRTDMGNITSYIAKWSRTVSVTPEDGYWATPYYDCLLQSWVVQYSVPFYQLDGATPEFKGVVLLEANFESIKINQCATDGSLFSDTHRCKRTSTECKNIPTDSLRLGSYECICKPGHHFPVPSSSTTQAFSGREVELAYMDYIMNMSSNYTTDFNCLVMQTSAPSSIPLGAEPIVKFDFRARGIPLGIQSFCMTVSVVTGVVIVCLRKTKVMRSSIWILLEMLLLGAILLYATVVIQYFEPTTTTCLLLPWFREVGFVIVYGVLVLKIYRILAEFQSRKAHRVHVRDKDLLKYLAVILTVVIAYMSAWTAVNIDHLDNNSTILERLYTPHDGLSYTLCRAMWWDFVIEVGEFIFLCFGIYICYCVRSAQTEYSEGRYITVAICYEAVVSTVFYVLRHLWWYKLHPDYLFLMFFLRCQLTVTVVLLIILGPKVWYAHRPPDDDLPRSRAYSQSDVQDSSSPETMKLNVGISSNGDVEVGEISLTEMDPEDIRAELKRLYTQLQIYKTKTMRKDNPHISKRRGGRKQTHRRFSLQAFHHKHRHHHDHEHEHEMSKTPEESTNSAEAMAFTTEPSVKEDANEGRAAPSVSFKSGHK